MLLCVHEKVTQRCVMWISLDLYIGGSYFKRTKVPKDKERMGGLVEACDVTDKIIRRILTTDPKKIKGSKGYPLNDVSRKNLEKIQLDFVSCMDESRINAIGRRPRLNDLKQLITKTFPVRNSLLAPLLPGIKTPVDTPPASQATDRDRLTSALIQLSKDGVEPLVEMKVSYDSLDPALQQLYILQAGIGMDAVFYKHKEALEMYRRQVEDTFTLFLGPSGSSKPGKKRTRTLKNAKELANYVVDHESRVANINMTGDPGLYNLMTAQKMNEINPAIDWPRFLQATAKTDKASMASQNYQKALSGILKNTTDAGLQVYFAWKMINVHYSGLSAKYRVPIDKFEHLARGASDDYRPPKHADHCAEVANADLGAILGQFYLSKKGREIIDAVRSTYRVELGKAEWLDEATRKNAIKKLEAIDEVVAYSRFDPDGASAQSLATYYRTLEVKKNDFYGNQKRARAWRKAKQYAKAGKPTNRREYLNFGGLGLIVGHEITHGFDNGGRLFGPDGKKENWWTNATVTRFQEKAKCYVNQYNNFTVVGPERKTLHVNGTTTLDENISDNGGLKMAFKAWSTRFASDRKGLRYNNQLLPGLEKYSREQLFFIGYGQVRCEEDTPEYLADQVENDEHSPVRARANGLMQNSPDFSRAFKCKRNAKMNPAKKCEIW
ncbi:hypothetical protein DFQ26_003910 [Actinomortierella ambigua]|nr:hypothetical protein DFQ26_003910 [Actinomortierella ambigua]